MNSEVQCIVREYRHLATLYNSLFVLYSFTYLFYTKVSSSWDPTAVYFSLPLLGQTGPAWRELLKMSYFMSLLVVPFRALKMPFASVNPI